MIKELNIEPYKNSLEKISTFLDNFEFKKVKTKYTKGDDWTALSFHGYGNHPLDILKPGVLKSLVKIDTKLQYTTLINLEEMKPILQILDKLPCSYERVRFMKLAKGKIINLTLSYEQGSLSSISSMGFISSRLIRVVYCSFVSIFTELFNTPGFNMSKGWLP